MFVILHCYLILCKKAVKTNTINLCYWKYLFLPYLRSWVLRDKRERSSRGLKLHLTTPDTIQKFSCHRNVICSRHNDRWKDAQFVLNINHSLTYKFVSYHRKLRRGIPQTWDTLFTDHHHLTPFTEWNKVGPTP